jgi:hypothetical protein
MNLDFKHGTTIATTAADVRVGSVFKGALC